MAGPGQPAEPERQALSALPWEATPVAAATSELSRGRIETRTIRVLPAPEDTGFEDAAQAILIERSAPRGAVSYPPRSGERLEVYLWI